MGVLQSVLLTNIVPSSGKHTKEETRRKGKEGSPVRGMN